LALVATNNAVPLAELVGYRDGKYSVDGDMIRQVVDSVTTADPRYTPSNARREARKLATQALYEAWRKAYRDLKKQHRNMTGVWYSRRIEKMDIANGRSAETIRKHMKKGKSWAEFFRPVLVPLPCCFYCVSCRCFRRARRCVAIRVPAKPLICSAGSARRRAESHHFIAQIAQLPCVSSDPDSRKES
jgi:hypothetical protein